MPQRTRVPAFARAPAARRALRVLAIVLTLGLATVLAATIATGRVSTPPRSVDPAALTVITAPGVAPGVATGTLPPSRTAAPVRLVPVVDFPVTEPAIPLRPVPALQQPLGVIVVPTPAPAAGGGSGGGGGGGGGGATGSAGRQVSGAASWYCQAGVSPCHYQYAGGLYAAAGPALRVGNWRGRAVRVCGGAGCVTVRLIDWCQCYGTRVIDLYSDAYRQLAPLSTGTMRVTVSW